MDAEQVEVLDVQEGRKSCSVLPFSIPPGSENIFFLLGKESGDYAAWSQGLANARWNHQLNDLGKRTPVSEVSEPVDIFDAAIYPPLSSSGPPSHAHTHTLRQRQRGNTYILGKSAGDDWCDFGGSSVGDETLEQAAARECIEECMNTICFWADENGAPLANGDDVQGVIAKLAEELTDGKFTFRIIICINHGAPIFYPRKYHICFVKQVPWQPDIQDRFDECYRTASHHNTTLRHAAGEKSCKKMPSAVAESPPNSPHLLFPHDIAGFDDSRSDIGSDIGSDADNNGSGDGSDGAGGGVDEKTNLPKFMFDEETHCLKPEYVEKNSVQYFNIEALLVILSKTKTFLRPQFAPLLSLVVSQFGYALPSHRFAVVKQLSSNDQLLYCAHTEKKTGSTASVDASSSSGAGTSNAIKKS